MYLQSWDAVLYGRRVSIAESVSGGLRMLAIQGFTALRRRGLEIGGLLLGTASGDELDVDGFQEVPCEHRYGPSYALSDTDREKLTELLAERRSRDKQVIGAFRSVTGREPEIEPADEALVSEHHPEGMFLLILLQPLSAENCVVGLHLFQNGKLLREGFHDGKLLSEGEEAPTEVSPVEAELTQPEEPVVHELPQFAAFRAEPEEAPRRSVLWKAALICMAGALCGSFAYELGRSERPLRPMTTSWAELNLDAHTAGDQLEITCDRSVARSSQASRGVLTISDGASYREIQLSQAQLDGGRYIYVAVHPDVAVRLTLSAGDRKLASEMARLTLVPSPSQPPAPVAPITPADSVPEVPPAAVHQVQPVISEGIRSRLTAPVAIDVDVKVSPQGRVLSAQAKNPGTSGLNRYLAGMAENAAWEWRFTPARNHAGDAIAANKRIQFVFTSRP